MIYCSTIGQLSHLAEISVLGSLKINSKTDRANDKLKDRQSQR